MELSWWCLPVSAVLAAATWIDARRRGVAHQAAWAAAAALTWISVLAYLVVRSRPATQPSGGSRTPTTVNHQEARR